MYNPFDILGTWRLTSENSDELIAFMSDGVYRIYYEIPFRMIEMGEWSINNGWLILSKSKIDICSRIVQLENQHLVLIHKGENAEEVYDSFAKVG